MAENVSMYRAMRHLRKGGLHGALRLEPDTDIPTDRLDSATKSSNPHVQQMVELHKLRTKKKA